MKVFITEPAKASMRAIYKYYKSEGYGRYAKKLREIFISKAKAFQRIITEAKKKSYLSHSIKGTDIW